MDSHGLSHPPVDQVQNPQPNNPPSRSWWNRNWKWVVPVGCLTPILVCGGFITLVFTVISLINGTMKSSAPYTESLASLRLDPLVAQALGTPIEAGYFVNGTIELIGSSGHVDISYTVSGPTDSAEVYVIADKSAGLWAYTTFVVQLDSTGQRIDLMPTP